MKAAFLLWCLLELSLQGLGSTSCIQCTRGKFTASSSAQCAWDNQENLQHADDAGYWGTWRAWAMCPVGHFVIGFQERVEESYLGDNSALNAVRMLCSDQSTISSYDGLWGSWTPFKQCGSGSYFDGYKIGIQGDQGGGDDTAANAVVMYCGNEAVSRDPLRVFEGTYFRQKRACAQGYQICGFRIRFESDQGEGDDSAMNGIEVQCCQETPCTNCPTGSYQDSTGQTSCLSCPSGKYGPSMGLTTCVLCGAGKYSPTVGASGSSSCSACPDNMDSDEGSSACKCNKGFSGPNGGPCEPTPSPPSSQSETGTKSPSPSGPRACEHTRETDGMSLCLNTRRAPVAAVVGLFLMQELAVYAVEKSLEEIIGQAVPGLFGGSGGDIEEKCQQNLKIDFCNDIIFHSVSEEMHETKNERDMITKQTYDKIIQSEVRGGNQSITMKALTEKNAVCKQVVKQSLCLSAFPPCDCRADITACKNNCDLVNECARLAKGDKTISICSSCINYCEKSCRKASALSIGVRRYATNLLPLMLALATSATFASAVCNRL
eukprot:GHVU01180678.1.p1 GENE.GHVU01180678.1~~GHVU01180678.1.p1  ORF type:complete len:547 (-),score=38.07 GHVU01180678.1:92-1732(-)